MAVGHVSAVGMLMFLFALTHLPASSSWGSRTQLLRPENSAGQRPGPHGLREARTLAHAPLLKLRGGQGDGNQASASGSGNAPGARRSSEDCSGRESDHSEVEAQIGEQSREDEGEGGDRERMENRTMSDSGVDDGASSDLSSNEDRVREFVAEAEVRYGAGNQTLLGEMDDLGGDTFSTSTDDERVPPPSILLPCLCIHVTSPAPGVFVRISPCNTLDFVRFWVFNNIHHATLHQRSSLPLNSDETGIEHSPPHVWQTARLPLSRNKRLCCSRSLSRSLALSLSISLSRSLSPPVHTSAPAPRKVLDVHTACVEQHLERVFSTLLIEPSYSQPDTAMQ